MSSMYVRISMHPNYISLTLGVSTLSSIHPLYHPSIIQYI